MKNTLNKMVAVFSEKFSHIVNPPKLLAHDFNSRRIFCMKITVYNCELVLIPITGLQVFFGLICDLQTISIIIKNNNENFALFPIFLKSTYISDLLLCDREGE
jgi:hypothetical protein